jgi:hypothetical protein
VSLTRYATIVMAVELLLFLGALAVFGDALDALGRAGVLLGGFLAGANALGAYLLATWGASARSNVVFMQAILGGMLGRMFILLGAVTVAILLGMPKAPLIASLLVHYVIFLVLEVVALTRRLSAPSEAR